VSGRDVIKDLEAVLKKHNASITSDNMGDIVLEVGNKFVGFGCTIVEDEFSYLDEGD
jgi:hypothetical protein